MAFILILYLYSPTSTQMLTKSQHLRTFFIKFYNFTGILCIKVKSDVLIPSKIQAIWNVIKIILGVTYQILFLNNPQIKSFIYDDEVALLKNYSDFSYYILGIAVSLYQYSICTLVILQSKRYKKISKFIVILSEFDNLVDPYSSNFKKYSIIYLFLVLTIFYGSSIPQFFSFLTLKKKIGIVLHFLSYFLYIPAFAFVHFLYSLKLFLILNLKKIENELNNW